MAGETITLDTLHEEVVKPFVSPSSFDMCSRLLVVQAPDETASSGFLSTLYDQLFYERKKTINLETGLISQYWPEHLTPAQDPLPPGVEPPTPPPPRLYPSVENPDGDLRFLWLGVDVAGRWLAVGDILHQLGWHFPALARRMEGYILDGISPGGLDPRIEKEKVLRLVQAAILPTARVGAVFKGGLLEDVNAQPGLEAGVQALEEMAAFHRMTSTTKRIFASQYASSRADDAMRRWAADSLAQRAPDMSGNPLPWGKTLLGQGADLLLGVSPDVPVVLVLDHTEQMDQATEHFVRQLFQNHEIMHRVLVVCIQHKNTASLVHVKAAAGHRVNTLVLPPSSSSPSALVLPEGRVGDFLALMAGFGPVVPIAWLWDLLDHVQDEVEDRGQVEGDMRATGFIRERGNVATFTSIAAWQVSRDRLESVLPEWKNAVSQVRDQALNDPQTWWPGQSYWAIASILRQFVRGGLTGRFDLWVNAYLNMSREIGAHQSWGAVQSDLAKAREGKLNDLAVSAYISVLADFDEITQVARELEYLASRFSDEDGPSKGEEWLRAGIAWDKVARHYWQIQDSDDAHGHDQARLDEAFSHAVDAFDKAAKAGVSDALGRISLLEGLTDDVESVVDLTDENAGQDIEIEDTVDLVDSVRQTRGTTRYVEGEAKAARRGQEILPRILASPSYGENSAYRFWPIWWEQYVGQSGKDYGSDVADGARSTAWERAKNLWLTRKADVERYLHDASNRKVVMADWDDYFNRMAAGETDPSFIWYRLPKSLLNQVPGDGSYSDAVRRILAGQDVVRLGDWVWRVLKEESDQGERITTSPALLLSEYVVARAPWNPKTEPQHYDHSWIREQLLANINAFVPPDARSHLNVQQIMEDLPTPWGERREKRAPGGGAVSDPVFLLSWDEVEKYSDQLEVTKPDQYLWTRTGSWYLGEVALPEGTKFPVGWWLRSAGSSPFYAAVVAGNGALRTEGNFVVNVYYGIRPALWLNLE